MAKKALLIVLILVAALLLALLGLRAFRSAPAAPAGNLPAGAEGRGSVPARLCVACPG